MIEMEFVNKKLDATQQKLLKNLIGQKLETIEGSFIFGGMKAWNTVRFHTSEFSLDVNLFRESIPMDDKGSLDETGIFSVTNALKEKLRVTTVPTEVTRKMISKKITQIRIFESEIKYFKNGNQYFQNNITKAIAFKLGDEWMVLDRQVWFDETIEVTFCFDVFAGIKDDKEDWQNGEDDENNNGVLTMSYNLTSYEV